MVAGRGYVENVTFHSGLGLVKDEGEYLALAWEFFVYSDVSMIFSTRSYNN